MSDASASDTKQTKLCPHCQKEIPTKAKRCPECQSDLRNWLNRHPVLSVLGLLILIPIIAGSISDNDSSTSSAPEKTPEEIAAEQKALEEWQTTPAGKLCVKHTDWQKEDCDRVAEEKVWIGMTYDMLVTSYGSKPDSVNPSNYGSGIRYQYCWYDIKPSCFYDNDNDDRIDSYN